MKKSALCLSVMLMLGTSFFYACKKEDTNTGSTTTSSTSSTATTATTASTSSTATTATTSSTASTASTSTTSSTSSTATTATTDTSATTTSTTSTTSTTATTSSTSTTSTTGSSASFVFENAVMPALAGSCNKGVSDFEVTGTVTSGDSMYNVIVSFGSDQPVAGNFKTVFSGSSTTGLTASQCRVDIELIRISDGFTQYMRAQVNQDVTLTSTGTDKYKVSFGVLNFGIQPVGTSIRTASATAFGCE